MRLIEKPEMTSSQVGGKALNEQMSNLTDKRKQIGQAAEKKAAQHLLQNGYSIVVKNWRVRNGEIDIIAKQGNTLVFVEVRSRHRSQRFGSAIESIDHRKQRKVRHLAEIYLAKHTQGRFDVRFDVIGIEHDAGIMKLTHLENAF